MFKRANKNTEVNTPSAPILSYGMKEFEVGRNPLGHFTKNKLTLFMDNFNKTVIEYWKHEEEEMG